MSLKPISDEMREALKLLGETPEQHQKQILQIQQARLRKAQGLPPIKLGPNTVVKDAVRDLNRHVEGVITSSKPVAQVVKDLVEPEVVWIPDAYVMFAKAWTCNNCKAGGSCLEFAGVWLRHKRERPTEDPSKAHWYKEVKGYAYKLPRILEKQTVNVEVCINCFDPTETSA